MTLGEAAEEAYPRGKAGVPAKPNRAHYLDQHPRDPTLPLYTGHLLKRPHKCNKVDFRNLNKGPDKVADDKYKELRNPPYRAKTAIGVTLLSMKPPPDGTNVNADPERIAKPDRNFKDRRPPKSPFGPMSNCIGRALACSAMTRVAHRPPQPKELRRHIGPDGQPIVYEDELEQPPMLTYDDIAELQLQEQISEALAAKRLKDEEELKAQRAAKAREEAEAGAAAAAAAAAAADEPASDSEETKKKLEEEERIKQVTRVLFDAVQNNKYKKVDELLSSGVDVNLRDQNGNTALHIACQNGAKKMIKVCLKHHANLDAQNRQGQTPCHYCLAYEYKEIAAFLIKKGANDLLTNEFGMTCYEGLKPSDVA